MLFLICSEFELIFLQSKTFDQDDVLQPTYVGERVGSRAEDTGLSLLQIKAAVCHIFILMTLSSNEEEFY